jgi:hypothetical protein
MKYSISDNKYFKFQSNNKITQLNNPKNSAKGPPPSVIWVDIARVKL